VEHEAESAVFRPGDDFGEDARVFDA